MFVHFTLLVGCTIVNQGTVPPIVLEKCGEPPPKLFSKTDLDISFSNSTFGRVVQGDASLKITPDVISVVSQSAADQEARNYLRCLAIYRDGFTRAQAEYIDAFNVFIVTNPSPRELLQWRRENPFPDNPKAVDFPEAIGSAGIIITMPENGSEVGPLATIKGKTDYAEMNHFILITASHTRVKYIQAGPLNVSENGEWSGVANFGSGNVGIGQEILIATFASNKMYTEGVLQAPLSGVPISPQIRVVRSH